MEDLIHLLDIQVEEVENFINAVGKDFTYEFKSGEEYRFINSDYIWDIYYEEQREQIEDLYLSDLNKVWWLEIDWDKTIDNVFQDGYGNHFSNYDGSEEECIILDSHYYIFRIN